MHVELSSGSAEDVRLATNVTRQLLPRAAVHSHALMRDEYDGVHRAWELAQLATLDAECV